MTGGDLTNGSRRSRSRSLRRRSYSRSRSRNRSASNRSRKSADKAKQPCVFYFSKEAKGCKFSGRDCKFSHDKYDYENWNKDGRDLPNTGLIFRETPVYPSDRRRSRSRSRRRSYSRSRSRSRSRSPRKKRIRERSFTLSPIRDGGYQPQGFSRTTRGFVNIPPDHVEKYVIDARDLKKRRLVSLIRYKEAYLRYDCLTTLYGRHYHYIIRLRKLLADKDLILDLMRILCYYIILCVLMGFTF